MLTDAQIENAVIDAVVDLVQYLETMAQHCSSLTEAEIVAVANDIASAIRPMIHEEVHKQAVAAIVMGYLERRFSANREIGVALSDDAIREIKRHLITFAHSLLDETT